MKLDPRFPYGINYGPDVTKPGNARYVQGGMEFDVNGDSLPPKRVKKDDLIEHDGLVDACAFLLHILKGQNLTKAEVYKVAETNNQDWTLVKQAAIKLELVKFKFRGAEVWKLPDERET